MIPEGQEDLFFALYNVTDRGSSWVGPAVVSLILQTTGSIRLAFLYPALALLAPLALHARLDFARGEADAKAYAVRHGTAQRATRGAMSVATAAAAAAAAAAQECGGDAERELAMSSAVAEAAEQAPPCAQGLPSFATPAARSTGRGDRAALFSDTPS